MKLILSNALKSTLVLTLILSIIVSIQSHRGGGKRGDHGPRQSNFDPKTGYPDPTVFKHYKDSKEAEFIIEQNFGPRKKNHKKGFMINGYNQEDQFLSGSDCPEHSILIDGDCVVLVDVGLINFLSMMIAGGLCLFIFIAVIIGLVFLCRKCKRTFELYRKDKIFFGSSTKKVGGNSHHQLNETHSSEHNFSSYPFYNDNNQINPAANIETTNRTNNEQFSDRANINVSNYSNLNSRNMINNNNDFTIHPNYVIQNDSANNNHAPSQYKDNTNNQINLNPTGNIFNSNNSLGTKINGILNYFPSLGKKITNKAFDVKSQNETVDTNNVEMNIKTDPNKNNPNYEFNPSSTQQLKNQNDNHNNNDNQTLMKHPINPFKQSQSVNIIQENSFVQQKNLFLNPPKLELNHIVIRGLVNNTHKNPFAYEPGMVDNNFPNGTKNQSFNSNGINNHPNTDPFYYTKFQDLPNEFANNINYPTFDKIETEANYSNESLIKRSENQFQ